MKQFDFHQGKRRFSLVFLRRELGCAAQIFDHTLRTLGTAGNANPAAVGDQQMGKIAPQLRRDPFAGHIFDFFRRITHSVLNGKGDVEDCLIKVSVTAYDDGIAYLSDQGLEGIRACILSDYVMDMLND